jgi:endonuclease/exonuclease/phosphatase family metal-dependent hydrolase
LQENLWDFDSRVHYFQYKNEKGFHEMMRIMTFNLRFENDTDGPNEWICRREMVADLISRHSPDILGTQEGRWPQLLYLEEKLPQYHACINGRIYDPKVQCPTLFIKKERFEIIEHKDVWLSETPRVYLSKSWDSAFPRMMSYCRMRDCHTGVVFHACVTHLDHQGETARLNQAKIVAQWARQAPPPIVLMGDFNESAGLAVHKALTAPETPLRDTWQVLNKPEDDESFTHHGFSGIPRIARLDWRLVDPSFRVLAAEIIHDQVAGSYPSDHFPYMADIELT